MSFEAAIHAERVRRAKMALAIKRQPSAPATALRRCQLFPDFWAQNFLWSVDPRRPSGDTLTPLAFWDWQLEIFLYLLGRGPGSRDSLGRLRPVVWDKGRDVGATLIACAAVLWPWLFEPGTSYGLISRTGAEVWNGTERSLFGKILHMLERLPRWMRPRYEFSRSAPQTLTNLDNGNVIIGSKSTPSAFHSERHTRIICDEWARVLHADEAIRGINGATDAPVLISTPRGLGNHFARVVHGLEGRVVQPTSSEDGWAHFRTTYHLDPRKTPEWVATTRARLTDQEWAEQHECDYSGSAVGRIWSAFSRERHVLEPSEWIDLALWDGSHEIIEAWDFGSGASLTAVVWCAYVKATDTLYLLDYRQWAETDFDSIADEVGDAGWQTDKTPHERCPDYRVGDIAGRARDSSQRSWIGNLASRGIHITGQSMQYGGIEHCISSIAKALRDDRLLCAPAMTRHYKRGLPSGVEIFEQYRREQATAHEHVGGEPKPRKDVFSHLADAYQHAAMVAWPTTATGATLQKGARKPKGWT